MGSSPHSTDIMCKVTNKSSKPSGEEQQWSCEVHLGRQITKNLGGGRRNKMWDDMKEILW